MRFGTIPLGEAEGAILAHSLAAGSLRMKKGRVLTAADLAALAAAGVSEVTAARLEPGDLSEGEAAARIAAALVTDRGSAGLSVSAPYNGRVNIFAEAAGLLEVDAPAVDALNAVDPAITLATLPPLARVRQRQMVATVKIIPYAVPGAAVAKAVVAAPGALRLAAFRPARAALILTRTPGMKPSLLAKGEEAVRARLASLGIDLAPAVTVPHETAAVADAIGRAPEADLLLLLGASATSDAADVCPAGLVRAGGRLVRFGMPVDPGNLLFVGELGGRSVVGMPGCARSPALNGADWILERLAVGLHPTDADIAAMGVGGLLKEIAARPQPREGRPLPQGRPRVAAIILAAGAGRRMRGRDKLLEPVAGRPAVRAVAEAAGASRADEVIVVLQPGATDRRAALDGLSVRLVDAPDWAEGMAASLRAGLSAATDADAAMILLADMPEVTADGIDRLIAAFAPAEGREICRAVSADGAAGHPVLFGRRFFEALAGLEGDRGARDILRDAGEFIVEVPTGGRSAVVDLDTPEEWDAWRAQR